MKMIVNSDLCRGCGVCIGACPNNAISLSCDTALIDLTKCNLCRSCIEICPVGAISLSKSEELAISAKQNSIAVPNTPETQNLTQQKVSWGALAISLFGQQVLPKMLDVVTNYFEQRLVPTSERRYLSSEASTINYSNRRRRQRRGRMNG